MSKILDFLIDTQVFFIATQEGDQPRVRPFGLVFELDEKLYFGVGDFKPSYRQLLANPKFEITALNKDNQWLRLTANAAFDDRQAVQDKAFEILPSLKERYTGEGKPHLATFYATDVTYTIEDFKGNRETGQL